VRSGQVQGLNIDFDKLWPKEEVAALTPAQRVKLLELALAGLKGNNWEHARDVLIVLGKDSAPPLIAQVESPELTAAAAAPIPVVVRSQVKTLGELSHDVLLQMVEYHSDYRGQLPVRERSAWEAWWARNGAGLKIR
jgi:hypothetical protein